MNGGQDRPVLYHNRELSWLKFNQRVLEQACDRSIPLMERLKFLSIFSNNLDEFFMVRVGTLTDAALLDPAPVDNKSGMTPAQQLEAIFAQCRGLASQKDAAYRRLFLDAAQEGIEQVDLDLASPQEREFLEAYFLREVLPLLSPQIIDKHHPFPFLKNKETYVCVQLRTKGEFVKLGIIPAPVGVERVVRLPFKPNAFVLLEELILHYCAHIFQGYTVAAKTIFRITRNADINMEEALYDHELDYRSAMEQLLKNRRRLLPVRIQFQGGASEAIVDQLCRKLELDRQRVFFNQTPLDMSFGYALCAQLERQGRTGLFYPPLTPQDPAQLRLDQPLFPQIERRDLLLSYPYESMKPFIALLEQAAADPAVLSIRMTLYRVARESQVVAALIKAAEKGKEVHVVVELRARFDEENNIEWSKRLEEAGANVVYGLGAYKVHSKLLVITRKKPDGSLGFITQVGTGNYNESTAKLYTDLCLITANREFGEDGTRIFNGILTGQPVERARHLLAAPHAMKQQLLSYIDGEIRQARQGKPARIWIKINSLTDKEVIDRLIQASMAGVPIRMVVRGICCLRAGVPGYTDNIQVVSIVGRFLEHSRIYVFGEGAQCRVYISSADLMTRNMDRRVEVAAPVYDPELKTRLLKLLELEFSDNVKAQQLQADGSYQPVQNGNPPTDSQIDLYKLAYLRAQRAAQEAAQRPVAVSRRRGGRPGLLRRLGRLLGR